MNRAQRRYLDATLRPVRRRIRLSSPSSGARDDREWFRQRPDQSQRIGDRVPGEAFGSRNDPALVVSHD